MKSRLAALMIPLLLLAVRQALSQGAGTPSAEPTELTQLRQQFSARALASSKTLSEQFANALASLAKEAGMRGEYELALKAQQRRDELANLYSTTLEDPSLSNVIVLRPDQARVSGSVNLDRSKDALVGWKTAGSTATWDVNRIVAGKYDVVLTYGVADEGDPPSRVSPYLAPPDLTTGGNFEFYEDSSLPGASGNRRPGVVTSTGGWGELSTLTLAPIELTRSSARFALKITYARGDGGVMHLKQIRLVPAKTTADPAMATNADGEPEQQVDEFTRLQQEHQERLRQALMPVVLRYTEFLATQADQLKGDRDAVEELRVEIRRVERLGDNPRALLQLRDRTRPAPTLADGLHEIRDARYVPALENRGDRFLVTLNGETFPVKLLWVDCPPVAAGPDTDVLKSAGYFGISEEDAIAIGVRARDFTSDYLTDKPLRLLTRGFKDADGVLLASVYPEGLGDFAGVLVDNGLAMVERPADRTKTARLYEEAALASLMDREAAARSCEIPRGAWALSTEIHPPADR